jgi:hypothetical protein
MGKSKEAMKELKEGRVKERILKNRCRVVLLEPIDFRSSTRICWSYTRTIPRRKVAVRLVSLSMLS